MKPRFGHYSKWSWFIEGYVKTAVYQWKTIEDARVWYGESGFVHRADRLWEIKMKHDRSLHDSVVTYT